MKGDFSRDTFDAARHFSRVLMQQGRVQLDADWNEQASILLHYLQTLAADLIGPHAGPAGALGFEITPEGTDLKIGKGRYYVDGVLCENEGDCWYSSQPDYPLPDDHSRDLGHVVDEPGEYGVYLDVWERHITYLDDDHIREVALGGPDTATRARVVWQVKIKPLPGASPSCDLLDWGLPSGRPHMQAQVDPGKPSADPCITAPDAKYRGAENQLYRVEVHEVKTDEKGGVTGWSFKWSRDNGSLAAAVVRANGAELTIYPARGFTAGQWVELVYDGQELRGEPGKMARVVKVESDTLTIELPDAKEKVGVPNKVRGWDQRAVEGKEGVWINLEHGIQVCFEPKGSYRSGDYWLIPARVASGNIEWPLDKNNQPEMLPARGIEHHYAPLALLSRPEGNLEVTDCRRKICREDVSSTDECSPS